MSAVVSFRVPKKLKEDMEKLSKYVDWSAELRAYVEKRVRELKKELLLRKLDELISRLPELEEGEAVRYVREDRDSH